MAMRRVLRDTLPQRKCWADLVDSSQEGSRDETAVPPAPIIDDSKSYDAPAAGVENSKDGLNSRLAAIMEMKKGPIDFSFLMDDMMKSTSQVCNSSSVSVEGKENFPNFPGASSKVWPQRPLNPTAPVFMPVAHSDLLMPPPPVPQEALKKTKGKRPLSIVQEKFNKRNKDQESVADTEQRSLSLPIPEASEEEWRHRIAKRQKAVAVVKGFPEYLSYSAGRPRHERLASEPQTPSAEDRSFSKRRWEYELQQWRTQLKSWSKDGVVDEFVQRHPPIDDAF